MPIAVRLSRAFYDRFGNRLERRLASLEARLSSQLVTHMRWMIGILVMMSIAVIGLWFRH